jgi:hypothetical protein
MNGHLVFVSELFLATFGVNELESKFIPTASTTSVSTVIRQCDFDNINLTYGNKEDVLTKEELQAFKNLEDVWGDDEDQQYDNLYQHLTNGVQ